jgi:hypothetical protein
MYVMHVNSDIEREKRDVFEQYVSVWLQKMHVMKDPELLRNSLLAIISLLHEPIVLSKTSEIVSLCAVAMETPLYLSKPAPFEAPVISMT